MRHYIRGSWILMKMAVGLEDRPRPWWWLVYARYPDNNCALSLLKRDRSGTTSETATALHKAYSLHFLKLQPEILCKYLDQKPTGSPCLPLGGQQVQHQEWIWETHCIQATKHTQARGSALGFKVITRHHQNPKDAYQWPYKKNWCPQIKFKKKKIELEIARSANFKPFDFFPGCEHWQFMLFFMFINIMCFNI